jgi:hypothetical protein
MSKLDLVVPELVSCRFGHDAFEGSSFHAPAALGHTQHVGGGTGTARHGTARHGTDGTGRDGSIIPSAPRPVSQ